MNTKKTEAEITIEYAASVFTPAGWRSVTITAKAQLVSAKMAEVTQVTHIGGCDPVRNMSRTGANRQKFNGAGVALREVGKRKRLSTCQVIA